MSIIYDTNGLGHLYKAGKQSEGIGFQII